MKYDNTSLNTQHMMYRYKKAAFTLKKYSNTESRWMYSCIAWNPKNIEINIGNTDVKKPNMELPYQLRTTTTYLPVCFESTTKN